MIYLGTNLIEAASTRALGFGYLFGRFLGCTNQTTSRRLRESTFPTLIDLVELVRLGLGNISASIENFSESLGWKERRHHAPNVQKQKI